MSVLLLDKLNVYNTKPLGITISLDGAMHNLGKV